LKLKTVRKSRGNIQHWHWMALPFFRSTLAGDIVYSAVLFGTLALAEAGFPMLREPAAQARVV
jgi:hypothetical protein